MQKSVLLFHFEDQERRNRLIRALLPLKLKVKVVDQMEEKMPVGYLAGNQGVLPEIKAEPAAAKAKAAPEAEEGKRSEKEPQAGGLDAEMLLMAGLSSVQVDMVLKAVRKAGIGPIPYKAVLTPTNQSWSAKELLNELKKEHESMSRGV